MNQLNNETKTNETPYYGMPSIGCDINEKTVEGKGKFDDHNYTVSYLNWAFDGYQNGHLSEGWLLPALCNDHEAQGFRAFLTAIENVLEAKEHSGADCSKFQAVIAEAHQNNSISLNSFLILMRDMGFKLQLN